MPFDRIFLDELSARNDIVEIVSQYVQLKKSGANYFGLCPFHNEKTGSFSVSPVIFSSVPRLMTETFSSRSICLMFSSNAPNTAISSSVCSICITCSMVTPS